MRILLLADHSSAHTLRWVQALCKEGVEVFLFSLINLDTSAYDHVPRLTIRTFGFDRTSMNKNNFGLEKLRYLTVLSELRSFAREVNPDLVHAHYATSYGLLGSLLGRKPFILSVWGTDVYDFPGKSFLHRMLLKYNFRKADKILSTSQAMAREVGKYTRKQVEVTPFGIDTEVFKPPAAVKENNTLVIGTIKSLEDTYGIDLLIEAFHQLTLNRPSQSMKLLIVGGGSREATYHEYVTGLGMDELVEFTGRVNYAAIVSYYNRLDVYVALSRSESFGVAILEASSCGLPVVVSDVGGLPEVVHAGETGFIVPAENVKAAVEALEKLADNEQLRTGMGERGRKWVKEHYDWNTNVAGMLEIYRAVL